MTKLSVIICVYNTEIAKFQKCLQSIFNSTFTDFEVIVIDDGSTVNYSDILKDYKINYIKTENHGTLAARILGVNKAKSPYICFVDSDDTLSPHYFQAGIENITKTNSDILINDWAFHTDKTKYVCAKDSTISQTFTLKASECIDKFFKQEGSEHSYYVLWNKIFKRELMLKCCEEILKFNLSNLVYAEDLLISYFAFLYAQTIVNIHLGFYFYRVHNSQQISVSSIEKLTNHIDSICTVFDIIERNLKNNKMIEKYQNNLLRWKQMISYNNHKTAKSLTPNGIDDYIKSKFKLEKIFKPKNIKDVYSKHTLLPNNIDKIDFLLIKLPNKKNTKVFAKKNSYTFETITKMNKYLNTNFIFTNKKADADFISPNEKISFKQKIIHNSFFYSLGILLFPKGSKIRNFLKKKL